MTTRVSFLSLVGLAAGLLTTGCPGDDGDSTTTEMPTGTSATQGTNTDPTQGTNTETTQGTASGTSGSTSADTTADTATDDTTTTGVVECPYDEVPGMPPVTLELVGEGFDRPLLALGHPTEPDRLFVLEQGGSVRILEPGQTMAPAQAFLTVSAAQPGNPDEIGPEYGLLGFAFHPNFPDDPRVYVNYNPDTSTTRVSEFMLDPGNPDQVDPGSERIILEVDQPAPNHNGGMIDFGPDGYLYISMGDGGGGGDTFNTGHDPDVVHAKMLRIGVEPDGMPDDPLGCMGCTALGPFDYTIPGDNPFVNDPAFAPETYAWGLRNPWRYARDPQTGLIYAGDVGQNAWEEITLIEPGADLGWSDMEGFHCYGGAPCDTAPGPNEINMDGMTMPLVEYEHAAGRCSVTGGAVYRSCEVPAWDGVYFYGDYCSGEIFALVWDGNTLTDLGVVLDQNELPLGNGWNAYGDVFITTVDAAGPGGPIFDGRVHRLAPGA